MLSTLTAIVLPTLASNSYFNSPLYTVWYLSSINIQTSVFITKTCFYYKFSIGEQTKIFKLKSTFYVI